ncbi:hypothetical protein Hlac_3239 [Halorubrum lacusprofundi ATCC 49239]|jgi:hypothetical protein|uniref:Uncharacterized protein n=1 Tax=Halorubrum lacusprofundi (strain ATCC 49239 / DSM 5036 / JCM 8891 / ACAM 34) TaxID=416348 RepID=B9LVQ6_HALLT|nr:hypothetical protein [Halorubrum lacusprofundi]ACM58769.1 hypothetical protein Hlac_3239 [Halorubrum lacusprofundi ATCC 49239]
MGFPMSSRGSYSEAGLQRSIQGLILAFFSFDLLLTVYNSLSYFLPIISAISSAGVVPVFNVQVSLLKGLLLVVLLGLAIPDVKPDRSNIEQAYLLLLSLGVVLYYRLWGTLIGLYLALSVALAVSVGFAQITSGGNWRSSLADGLDYTNTVALLGIGAGVLSAFSYLPQILLGLFGLYYGARWLLAKARIPDASQVDPEERLYRATMRLSETPTGVLTAGIVYAGLLSTTSVILSFVLPILVRSGFSLSPRALVLNLSYIFGMAFQVVIFYYWFALLQRAPYSVDHWRASRFEYATQKNAPHRPRPLNLLLPTVGWILTQYPSSALEQYGPVIVAVWSAPSIWTFLALLVLFLGYSLVLVQGFRWLEVLPLAGFLTPSERSIEDDFTTFVLSMALLLLAVAVVSPSGALLLVPVPVMFLFDHFLEREAAAITSALILVACLSAPLVVRLETLEGEYWSLALLTIFLYGMTLARRSL